LRTSFLAAVAEFRADGDYPVPWFIDDVDPPALDDPAAFGAYVARLLGERTETGCRDGFVPATTLWWADGEQFLGRLTIRHRLTPALETIGGHIGYDVRPSARRRGHATAMLAAALPIGAEGVSWRDQPFTKRSRWGCCSQLVARQKPTATGSVSTTMA
jgi:GNAT superfamily N-acetyltransferase